MTEKQRPFQMAHNVAYPKLVEPILRKDRHGKFVAVRLSGDEDKRTHLGIYMGDMPNISMTVARVEEDGHLVMRIERNEFGNPAIYVPALNQIVYGMESWWGTLNSPDDLKQITDQDIDNVWYVQALKSLTEEEIKSLAEEEGVA